MKIYYQIILIIISGASVSIADQTHSKNISNLNLSLNINCIQKPVTQTYLLTQSDIISNYNTDDLNTDANSGKDPGTCFLLAFFPGFCIHGLGHYYIGENKTGTILLATEVLSIGCIFLGIGASMAEMDGPNETNADTYLALTSFALFFGSWTYDWVKAPKKARQMRQNQAMIIYPSFKEEQVNIHFAVSW